MNLGFVGWVGFGGLHYSHDRLQYRLKNKQGFTLKFNGRYFFAAKLNLEMGLLFRSFVYDQLVYDQLVYDPIV